MLQGVSLYSNSDFRMALLILLASLLLALFVACGIKKTYCRRINELN